MKHSKEYPMYQCHKRVRAFKIADVLVRPVGEDEDGCRILMPSDARYEWRGVDKEYIQKHNPQPGGYYVLYKDGYESYSPAETFENGYVLLGDDVTETVIKYGAEEASELYVDPVPSCEECIKDPAPSCETCGYEEGCL